MNLCNAIKNLSVDISIKSCKCTAFVVRHVNKTPYLFIRLLLDVLVRLYCLIVTGPKHLTHVIVKCGLNKAILSFGKFSISWGFGFEQRCLYNKHFDKTL